MKSEGLIITGHNISGIQLVVVFDKAEPIHQFDLRDLAGAMATEMFLDITFGHCGQQKEKVSASITWEISTGQMVIQGRR